MRTFFAAAFISIATLAKAQQTGVAISGDGSGPHNSAIFEIKSTNKGVLIPRMSSSQRQAIQSPATGLMVYDLDREQLFIKDPDSWRAVLNGRYWSRSSSGSYVYNTTDSIGIGTVSPNEKLEVVNGSIRQNLANTISSFNFIKLNANLPLSGGWTRYQGMEFSIDENPRGSMRFISSNNNVDQFRFSLSSSNAGDFVITKEGHVGIGTQFPSHVLDINGGDMTGNTIRLYHGSSPTIQFAAPGGDKGFIQISGDNLRMGTNSENSGGKFIVRTNGYDQFEVDGSSGSNIIRLYAGGTQRAFINTLTNNNLSIGAQNSSGLVILNGEVYINGTGNATGLGTSTPDERLHVMGNIKIENGELHKAPTGTFNMMPLCYGRINANGTIHTATPNVTVDYLGDGNYDILCPGINEGSTIMVTVYGSTRYAATASYISSGKARVVTENLMDVISDPGAGIHYSDPKTFYFIIYNP